MGRAVQYIITLAVILSHVSAIRAPSSLNQQSITTFIASNDDSPAPARIQYMVTNRMRKVLEEELGYHSDEVDTIEPQIAAVVIERGLTRPSNGMPASWSRKQEGSRSSNNPNPLTKVFKPFARIVSKVFSTFRVASTKFIPAAIPLIALIYLLPFCSEFLTIYGGNIKESASQTIEKIKNIGQGSESNAGAQVNKLIPKPSDTAKDEDKKEGGEDKGERSRSDIDMQSLEGVNSHSVIDSAKMSVRRKRFGF